MLKYQFLKPLLEQPLLKLKLKKRKLKVKGNQELFADLVLL